MRIIRKMKSDLALTIEPDTALSYPQPSFHETFSFVIVFGQFFGIMPLYGMTRKNVQEVRFTWKSARLVYATYNFIGAFVMGVFCILQFALDGLMLDKTATMSFYILNSFAALQFILTAKNWSIILKEWSFMEMSMRGYSHLINLKKKFIILISVIMLLALVEHLLFITNALMLSQNCKNYLKYPDQVYFAVAFPSVFTVIDYSPWKASLVEIANILATVTWNFTDLFIILISCSLAARFSQINKRLENSKVVHEKFWKEIREDYNKLAHLTGVVDRHLSPLITISFVSNTFFICVQLYNSLKERVGIVETIYYFFSFGFLLGRTVAVTLYGAWINDESRKPLQILHSVPSEHYCGEISRLIQQINSSPVGITGLRFFMMASTIVTFELMFLQFGPLMKNNYSPADLEEYSVTCLSEEGDMRSVFSIDESIGETMRLFEMLMSCAAVQVLENDGLPNQLCERSDATLRQLLGKPMQATFMELKPLLTNEPHEPTLSDVINTVTGNIHSVTGSVAEVLNSTVDTVGVNNINIHDTFKCENSPDFKTKLEFVDNDVLGGMDPDSCGSDLETKVNLQTIKKDTKKRKIKDDTEQPIYPCEECTQCFTTMVDLKAHSKTHPKILCGSGSLAMHMKTHTGVKDHICPYCGKGFTTPSNLIIHKRTHTGERPYVCNECGKGFPDPSRLTVHARSHSGEKPYVCSDCGRGCVSSSQLKKHRRIHTGEKPYQCNLCPKAFPRSEDLRIHIKTHTGDRNHICGICKKGFYQASTLKVHLRIHTGEKPRYLYQGKRLESPGAYEAEGKTTVNILNNETELGLMINGFSQMGFRLNNDITVLGSMVIFPRSVLSWSVSDINEITEESLSLLTILEPKLDIVVLGIGDPQKDFSFYKKVVPFSRRHKLTFEILPTLQACATFNFLNSEGRHVAGALIPPQTVTVDYDDVLKTKLRYQNLYERE
ncbi:zinc finger protein 2-like [Asbolus verrucosus]|uniref:Zinc finger protein 2-like n=1 Tax=Asbolus verrucosus TaxID=1661398 RepID=A0A482W5H1_ASBVE|nr:zinc finger protein 2-like [Asbolus verrucosus]